VVGGLPEIAPNGLTSHGGRIVRPNASAHRVGTRGLSSPGAAERQRTFLEQPGPFFSAAGEAMRRILIERARQKNSLKRNRKEEVVEDLREFHPTIRSSTEEAFAVHETLDRTFRITVNEELTSLRKTMPRKSPK